MVVVTIGYGLLIGSFFGIAPPAGSWLDRLVIKSDGRSIMQDREAMMLVAATIGVFHLVLANAIVAWRWIGSGHALASVGWAVGLIGGWLLALAMIPKPDVMTLCASWFGGQAARWSGNRHRHRDGGCSALDWGWCSCFPVRAPSFLLARGIGCCAASTA